MEWHSGQAYGQDLRDRVRKAQGTNAEIGMRYGVSESYVTRVRSRYRRLGETTAGAQHNHTVSKLSGLEQALAARVAAVNDQTLEQLCQWVKATHGVQVGVTTMWKTLARLGLSLKKKRSTPASRNGRT